MVRTLCRALWGVVAFLVLCEILLRALPVSGATETGYYFDDMILTYPAYHEWEVSTGWDLRNPQRLHSNNFGFVAEHDFVPNSNAVALIGDSFVEESMLPADERPGPQLERALGKLRPVYAMGAPGSSLLDYAERIRFAHERFKIQDFVLLLERGDVRQSLCGSGNVHSACLDPVTLAPQIEKQAPPSLTKSILRHSALAQYVFGQLKIAPARLWRQAFARIPPRSAAIPDGPAASIHGAEPRRVAEPSREIDIVAATFFERIRPYATGRLVLIMDSDRARLAAGSPVLDPDRLRFMALARKAGAVVVDTEPLFARQLAVSPLHLEVGPYDGHFNTLAVRLVANAAAAAFEANSSPP